MDEGWDIPQFIRDFREYLRQTMIEQLAQPKSPETLQIAGRPVSLAEILHIIKVMGQCVDDMRWNDNPRLVLELYSLRLTQPFVDAGDLLRRLEALEKGVSPSQTPSPLVGEVAKPAGDSPEVWRGGGEGGRCRKTDVKVNGGPPHPRSPNVWRPAASPTLGRGIHSVIVEKYFVAGRFLHRTGGFQSCRF